MTISNDHDGVIERSHYLMYGLVNGFPTLKTFDKSAIGECGSSVNNEIAINIRIGVKSLAGPKRRLR